MQRQSASRTRDARVRCRVRSGFPLSAILCVLTLHLSSHLRAAPGYSLDWDAVAGGGGVSTAGRYTLVDIVGQPDAGAAIHEALRWEVGFLPGLNLQPAGNASDWVLDEDTTSSESLTGFDWDGELLTFALDAPPTHGTIVLEVDGTFTYSPAKDYHGTDSFTFKVNDGEFDSPSAPATLTILPVNDPPVVECTLIEQLVQYSDPILNVAVKADDVDSPGASLTATTTWQKVGGSVTVGLPDGVSLAVTTTTENSRTWNLSGCPQVAPGTYLICVAVADNVGDADTIDLTLVVKPEDARATYTGALFASTASVSSGLATVTLSATIQDVTAVLGDEDWDSSGGDIRNATVTFINRDNNTIIVADVPVGLVSLSDPTTGTATYNWSCNIGSADSDSITVGIIVNGWYARNASEDNTVVTISKPYASDFITGGGYLLLENSAGLCAGDPGTKANFGFNVKYNKSGRSLQGRINTIVRRTGHVYQIKGTAMTSLSVAANQATFNGKASIQDITDPLVPISVDGNATLQVTMTDNGEPGSADKIATTVWNKKGGLWFASNWNGKKTVEQILAGGNLVVRSARMLSLTALPALASIRDEPLLLTIDLLPDPPAVAAPHPFVLRFQVVPRTDYAIERSGDLVTWTHLTTVMSFTDAVEYFDETDFAAGRQFYRVRTADYNPGLFPDPQSQ